MNTFDALGLSDVLLQSINDMGFETPSEVQAKAIPLFWIKKTWSPWHKQAQEKQPPGFLAAKNRCG